MKAFTNVSVDAKISVIGFRWALLPYLLTFLKILITTEEDLLQPKVVCFRILIWARHSLGKYH